MIYRTRKDRRRLMTLIMGLLSVCTVFSIGAAGQARAEKPLNPTTRAHLITELKEVVSKAAFDDAAAATIAAKWDARKDLGGKGKSAVIDVLWADVKTVIQDSGIRYQIYSIFAFYKSIPDANFAKSTKAAASVTKPAAVKTLVDLTFKMHPYVGIDEQLAMLPGAKAVKADRDEERKGRISGFEDALKANQKLNEDQKSFVRANYDKMIKMSDEITERAIKTNFPTETWIKEGLAKSYTAKFTLKELNDLNSYFQQAAGQQYLKVVRLTHMAEMITNNGGKVELTEAERAEHDKFTATALGKKFDDAYMHDTIAYEEVKESAVRAKVPNADGFAIYEPENLNKLFNKFVTENYKK